MEENLPLVRVRVTLEGERAPLEAKLEIDSGSTGAILFNTPFVKRHQLLATIPQAVPTNVGGVGGGAKTYRLRVFSDGSADAAFDESKVYGFDDRKYAGYFLGEDEYMPLNSMDQQDESDVV
jgi:hypothetical protein